MAWTNLDPDAARAWLADHPDAEILDVRTPPEFAAHHLEGAQLVPLDRLEEAIASLDLDRTRLIVCEHGIRSATACGLLEAAGQRGPMHNLAGGMARWIATGGTWTSTTTT